MVEMRSQQGIVAFHLVADGNRTLNLGCFRGFLRNNNDFHSEQTQHLKMGKGSGGLDMEDYVGCMYNLGLEKTGSGFKNMKRTT